MNPQTEHSPAFYLKTAAERMSKEANLLSFSAPQLFALSLLLGGGAYGVGRGVRALQQETSPIPEAPGTLKLQLPAHKPAEEEAVLKQSAAGIGDRAMSIWDRSKPHLGKALAVGLGLPAGFAGAGMLYNHFKQQEQKAELERSQKEYLALLQQIQAKTASVKTPLTDSFCEGLAKTANEAPIGWTRALLRSPLTAVQTSIPGWEQGLGATPPGDSRMKGLLSAGAEKVNSWLPGDPAAYVLPTLATIMLGSGVMAYKGLRAMDKKKNVSEGPPRKVQLEYV